MFHYLNSLFVLKKLITYWIYTSDTTKKKFVKTDIKTVG